VTPTLMTLEQLLIPSAILEYAGLIWTSTTATNGDRTTKDFAAHVPRGSVSWSRHIWYPSHLECAMRGASERAADLVAGTTLFYGPPGSGLRGLTGLFRSKQWEPPEWAPLSLLHRRSLVNKARYRRDPSTLALPSDVDIVKRLLASGACQRGAELRVSEPVEWRQKQAASEESGKPRFAGGKNEARSQTN